MLCRAFTDDDVTYLAVVQHMVDIVITGHQGLTTEVEFGVYLNWLRVIDFMFQDAKVGIKPQALQ
jgi:hypothetical protein